jgi:threonine 3-dehydrogenase
MRRARFRGDGRIEIEEVPRPRPADGELLIAVHACAICGSDRAAFEAGSACTPGHEISGQVVEAGARTSVAEGTLASVFLVAWCGRCARCRAGGRGACVAKEGMIGFDRDGGYAEYVVVPERCLLPLPPGLDGDDGVALLDVTGTALHALRRAGAFDEPPEAALVVGAGPVGLGLILALRAVGTRRVVVAEPAEARQRLATELGGEALEGGVRGARSIRDALPNGAPLVFDASGNPDGQRQALDAVAPGGTLVVVGHAPRPLELWTSRDLIATERTIMGSEYFDPGEFAENAALVLAGRLAPRRVITDHVGLDEIGEGYRRFWSGTTGKVLVHPQGVPRREEDLGRTLGASVA